jgi:hypothetical protein
MPDSSSVRGVHRSNAPAMAGATSSAVLLVSWAAATALWTGAVATLDGPPARIVGALTAASGFAWWLRRDVLRSTARAALGGLLLVSIVCPATSIPRVGAWAGGLAYGLAVLLVEHLSRVHTSSGPAILILTSPRVWSCRGVLSPRSDAER